MRRRQGNEWNEWLLLPPQTLPLSLFIYLFKAAIKPVLLFRKVNSILWRLMERYRRTSAMLGIVRTHNLLYLNYGILFATIRPGFAERLHLDQQAHLTHQFGAIDAKRCIWRQELFLSLTNRSLASERLWHIKRLSGRHNGAVVY